MVGPIELFVNFLNLKLKGILHCQSLVELITTWEEQRESGVEDGVALDYGLVVYVLGAEEELLGCASMKILDMETAAKYHKVVHGLNQEAVEAEGDTSSANKNGMFVFVSTIAAVGIAVVLGDLLCKRVKIGCRC